MEKQLNPIEQLEAFSQEEFASWLKRGFGDLHHSARELNAFAPLHYYIGSQRNDIIEDLKNIYNELSETAKENFCLGIKLLFSSLPPEPQYVPLVRYLLHLASKVHAVQILPEIVKQIGNGFFGIPEKNEGKELFALSLDILTGMATFLGVADTVRQLVGSSFFKSYYAPAAFYTLFRSEPENFSDHLALLRHDFTRLHSEVGTDECYLTATTVVQYIDLEILRKNLWFLYLTRNPKIIGTFISDNWLGEALFIGKHAPLKLTKDNHFYLNRCDQLDKRYKIIIPIRDTTFSHDNDIRRFLNYVVEETRKDQLEKDCEDGVIKKSLLPHFSNIFSRNVSIKCKITRRENIK